MNSRVRVDTNSIDWQNGLDVVRGMAPEFRANLGPADSVEELYLRYNQKVLRFDPDTTRRIDLIRVDAGYRDLTNAYHDSVEECLVLDGTLRLDGEGSFRAGDYFWRPPGWVHAAETTDGFTALLMMQGGEPSEGSGPASRRIRPDEEAGSNVLHGDAIERAMGPRGWVRCQPTALVAWQPGPVFARGEGVLDGFDLERVEFKVLSKNPWTGAQSLLVRLATTYAQRGRGRHSAAMEFYVIEGECQMGEEAFPTGSYLYRPAGSVELPLESVDGALLFAKVDGWLDRQLA